MRRASSESHHRYLVTATSGEDIVLCANLFGYSFLDSRRFQELKRFGHWSLDRRFLTNKTTSRSEPYERIVSFTSRPRPAHVLVIRSSEVNDSGVYRFELPAHICPQGEPHSHRCGDAEEVLSSNDYVVLTSYKVTVNPAMRGDVIEQKPQRQFPGKQQC